MDENNVGSDGSVNVASAGQDGENVVMMDEGRYAREWHDYVGEKFSSCFYVNVSYIYKRLFLTQGPYGIQ